MEPRSQWADLYDSQEAPIELLLDCTVPLTRTEKNRVWRVLDAAINDALTAGAREAASSQPTSWLSMSEDEKVAVRPRRRTSTGHALRLMRGEGQGASEVAGGEAA